MQPCNVSPPDAVALPPWLQAVLAIATGGLLGLAAPGVLPSSWAGCLAWVAFVPILVVVPRVEIKRAALLGWCSAMTLHLIACAWFPGLMARFNGLHPVLAVLASLLVVSLQSLGWAAWAAAVRSIQPRFPLPLVAGVGFVAVELVTPMAFPYSVGLTQYGYLLIAQAAELGGPSLLAGLMAAVGGAVAPWSVWAFAQRRPRPGWNAPAIAGGLLIAAAAFGWVRLGSIRAAREAAPAMRIGIVQAGVVHTGWSPPSDDPDVVKRYQHASEQLENHAGTVDLLLWPEKAYGLLLRNARHDYGPEHERRIRTAFRSTLLFGHTSVDRETREIGNAAALLEPDGRLRVVYEKVRLIPFSEWVPSWMDGWVGGGKRYRAGEELGPVMVSLSGDRSVPLGVFICYEATFPGHVRQVTNRGAEVLVNLSDDTWFGDTAEPEQHLAQAVFRAIESRRDVVRATGAGVSAFITAGGEITGRTEVNRARSAVYEVGEVRLLGGGSIFGLIGPAVPVACIGLLLMLMGVSWRK